jgi:hypothetical protein
VVSVLASGPKVRRIKPDRGRQFLRMIKTRSNTFFGGEVKPSAPCRKISRQVKDPYSTKRDTYSQIHILFRQVSPALLNGSELIY